MNLPNHAKIAQMALNNATHTSAQATIVAEASSGGGHGDRDG
jgi:hypothetical protein